MAGQSLAHLFLFSISASFWFQWGSVCFCLYCSPPSPPSPLGSWHRAAGTCLRCAPSTRRPGKCMWENHYVGQADTPLSSFNSSHLKLQMTGGRGRTSLQWPLLPVGWISRQVGGWKGEFIRQIRFQLIWRAALIPGSTLHLCMLSS